MANIFDYRELELQSLDIVLCSGNSKMSKTITIKRKEKYVIK